MKTLNIKDLARTEELGKTEMAAVRGGYNMKTSSYCPPSGPSWPSGPSYPQSLDSSIHVNQDLKQAQQVLNETADGSAFLSGVHVNNSTDQFGQNNVAIL